MAIALTRSDIVMLVILVLVVIFLPLVVLGSILLLYGLFWPGASQRRRAIALILGTVFMVLALGVAAFMAVR